MACCVRRFSPPLSSSLQYRLSKRSCFGSITIIYRYRYRLSTFSAFIVPKLFQFRHPTLLMDTFVVLYRCRSYGVVYHSSLAPYRSLAYCYCGEFCFLPSRRVCFWPGCDHGLDFTEKVSQCESINVKIIIIVSKVLMYRNIELWIYTSYGACFARHPPLASPCCLCRYRTERALRYIKYRTFASFDIQHYRGSTSWASLKTCLLYTSPSPRD